MLDENLPTFRYRNSSDNPLSSVLYFTQNGSDPAPEYVLRRADPQQPASRNKYAVALCAPYNPDVVYAEVMIEPEWAQPTLSAAEIRAQSQNGAPPAPSTAVVPDGFHISLYNPDQSVAVKLNSKGWNKSDSWEFEMPVQTFKMPSASELDRERNSGSPGAGGGVDDLITPRVMFRWKRDGRLSKDMTCYMSGKNLGGGRKSKEPDITIALFKALGKGESIVTVYEPNLRRVEVEDRKGLELVLLLGAQVVRDLYLLPKTDVFNVAGGAPVVGMGARRNSRPRRGESASPPAAAMSGALGSTSANAVPTSSNPSRTSPAVKQTPTFAANVAPSAAAAGAGRPPPSNAGPASAAEIEAETRRLKAMVEREEREREEKERREREKREKAEQKRIKKMLEEEEKERARREAEVAKETERLRREYGVEGQDLPSENPPLPPRNSFHQNAAAAGAPPQATLGPWAAHNNYGSGSYSASTPALPPRPVSVGPPSSRPSFGPGPGPGPASGAPAGPFHCSTLNTLWHGAAGLAAGPPPHMTGAAGGGAGGRRRDSGGAALSAVGSSSGGRHRTEDERQSRIRKKRSMHW